MALRCADREGAHQLLRAVLLRPDGRPRPQRYALIPLLACAFSCTAGPSVRMVWHSGHAPTYAYALDNPHRYVDPNGLDRDGGGNTLPSPNPRCVVLECATNPFTGERKCWCPLVLPDGRRQPLNEEHCSEANTNYRPLPPELAPQVDMGAPAPGGKGERGKTAKPDGTNDPFKKMRPDPDNPGKVLYRDPHTGKDVRKPKPPEFDEWWRSKHK